MMTYEKFPELKSLDNEGRLILARELCDQSMAEVNPDEMLPGEAIAIIEERVALFLQNPNSAISWEELKKQQGHER